MLASHTESFLKLINSTLEDISRGVDSPHHLHNVRCGVENIMCLLEYNSEVVQKADQFSRQACDYIKHHDFVASKNRDGTIVEDAEPIEKAGKIGALMTLNIRGKRSKTDAADNDPNMPDALEAARALDEEFARTGRLKGPLHGIVFAIKDQFDTFDMRSTSGSAAAYANDRPPRDPARVGARVGR